MANSETRDQTVYSHLEDGSVIEPIRIMKINWEKFKDILEKRGVHWIF